MQNFFKKFCIIKVPKQENERVDHFAWMGLSIEDSMEEIEEPVRNPTQACSNRGTLDYDNKDVECQIFHIWLLNLHLLSL
jgi:hypothetical protein